MALISTFFAQTKTQQLALILLVHFYLISYISCREGNGNPFQYSCLENPRNGGAWWAAVYGVTQSWTRLKQLSSSSSISYDEDSYFSQFHLLP